MYLEIDDYIGAHKVNAWIDAPDRWTIKDYKLANRTKSLVDYGLTDEALTTDHHISSDLSQTFPPWFRKECVKQADNAFMRYLSNSPTTAPGSATSIALNEQFLAPGDHRIAVQVTPVEADRSGQWYVTGRIVSRVKNDDKGEVVKSFSWDAKDYQGTQLGTPAELVNAIVTVAPGRPN